MPLRLLESPHVLRLLESQSAHLLLPQPHPPSYRNLTSTFNKTTKKNQKIFLVMLMQRRYGCKSGMTGVWLARCGVVCVVCLCACGTLHHLLTQSLLTEDRDLLPCCLSHCEVRYSYILYPTVSGTGKKRGESGKKKSLTIVC